MIYIIFIILKAALILFLNLKVKTNEKSIYNKRRTKIWRVRRVV